MGTNLLDAELVQRVQAGDKGAFDVLVQKYQHKVINLVGRFVSDHAECQDIAQDAFIKAFRAINSFRGDSQFYTWLYRIAANTAKNYLASRARKSPGYRLGLPCRPRLQSLSDIGKEIPAEGRRRRLHLRSERRVRGRRETG